MSVVLCVYFKLIFVNSCKKSLSGSNVLFNWHSSGSHTDSRTFYFRKYEDILLDIGESLVDLTVYLTVGDILMW